MENEDKLKKRREAMNYALGSSRYEGFVPNNEQQVLLDRYVRGEISREQLTEAALNFLREKQNNFYNSGITKNIQKVLIAAIALTSFGKLLRAPLSVPCGIV